MPVDDLRDDESDVFTAGCCTPGYEFVERQRRARSRTQQEQACQRLHIRIIAEILSEEILLERFPVGVGIIAARAFRDRVHEVSAQRLGIKAE